MSKINRKEGKKVLVRNAAHPLPKVKFIDEAKSENQVEERPIRKNVEKKQNLSTPELNTALSIAKNMDLVEKMRPSRSATLAFDEKTTRKMNFPLDQPIYKDLIPLHDATKPVMAPPSREPLPQKDKEPILADYIKPYATREYISEPELQIERNEELQGLNLLKLYKVLSIHNV